MDQLEKNISQFVEGQFPSVYRDEGPLFIAFVKKYYEWLEEQNNALYHTRRLYEYKDIDDTADDFVVYFKEMYLKNIQLETVQNTRQLIKHSLDLYRSKGSERALELLFKIAFGQNIKVYYPIDDLFIPSDGWWKIPTYMEVALSEENVHFVGKQITGIKSKATAFVETVVRRKLDTIISDIFYVSNVKGQFEAGESLKASGVTYRPVFFGSLNTVDIDQSGIGEGMAIGDMLTVTSTTGTQGKVKVTEIADISGIVTPTLVDGGYGYTANSNVHISDVVLTLDTNTFNASLFETIYQPLANLHYVAANGLFDDNTVITTYHANGSQKGTGYVLSVEESNTTSGRMLIEVLSGNMNANAIYSSGNAVGANLSLIDGYTDVSANGIIVGTRVSGSTIKVGVADLINSFYANTYVFTTNTLLTANITSVSDGAGFSIEVGSPLEYTENVTTNWTLLSEWANVALNATAYGLTGYPTGNSGTEMAILFPTNTVTFGAISFLTNIDPGSDYNERPFLYIDEWRSTAYNRHDFLLQINSLSSIFQIGEVVEQSATNARGIVLTANSTVMTVKNLRVVDQFAPYYEIVGGSSGATANVGYVSPILTTDIVGNNAVIDLDLTSANGAIKAVQVIDSGFGFQHNQVVNLSYQEQELTGFANVYTLGKGQGFYYENGGFPSGTKKLFDGNYWQNFSYDIVSSLTLDKYEKLLKDVVHMAGYKLFGTWEYVKTVQITDEQVETVIE